MKTLIILLLIKQSIATNFSSVKRIIITNAITSSIITTTNREIIGNCNILSDISNGYSDYKTDIIYSSIIASMFFIYNYCIIY